MKERKPHSEGLHLLDVQYPIATIIPQEVFETVRQSAGRINWGNHISGDGIGKFESQVLLGMFAETAILLTRWSPIPIDQDAFSMGVQNVMFDAVVASPGTCVGGMPAIVSPLGYSQGIQKLLELKLATIGDDNMLYPTAPGVEMLQRKLQKYGEGYQILPESGRRGANPILLGEMIEDIFERIESGEIEISSLDTEEERIIDTIFSLLHSQDNEIKARMHQVLAYLNSGNPINRVLAGEILKDLLPYSDEELLSKILEEIALSLHGGDPKLRAQELRSQIPELIEDFKNAEGKLEQLVRIYSSIAVFNPEIREEIRSASASLYFARKAVERLEKHSQSSEDTEEFITRFDGMKAKDDAELVRSAVEKTSTLYSKYILD